MTKNTSKEYEKEEHVGNIRGVRSHLSCSFFDYSTQSPEQYKIYITLYCHGRRNEQNHTFQTHKNITCPQGRSLGHFSEKSTPLLINHSIQHC